MTNDEIPLLIRVDKNDYNRIINGFANEDDAIMLENLFKNGVQPEIKFGKWIFDGDVTRCSNCKHAYDFMFGGSKYCPNCGAKMVEQQEEV